MALTDYIERALPGWMRKTAAAHWAALAFTVAAVFDALIEGVEDGAYADMPGQTDEPGSNGMFEFSSTDALPAIARDRRMFVGLAERPENTAAHLRDWYAVHRRAATAVGLLNELAAILSPNPPRLRLVNPWGTWWTREPDGTFKLQNHQAAGFTTTPDGVFTHNQTFAALWDWDSISLPSTPDKGDPGRVWIVVYAPCNLPYLKGTEGTWGDGKSKYGDPDGVIGTSATTPHVELVRAVANEFRTAGIKLSHIIIAYDPASFDPAFAAGHVGMPAGHWGHHSRRTVTIAGRRIRSRARNATARYYRGHAGTDY
jgi:hypothetical protein